VSHLPHLLAYALVGDIAARADAAQLFGFAAGGFRDFTRIAGSSPEMWRDIALQNRDALLAELDRYGARLAVFRELIDKGDGPGLQRLMAEARASRQSLGPARRSVSSE
jgi:prephenate dehydrogenase